MSCYFIKLFDQTTEIIDTVAHWLQHPRLGRVDCVVGIGLSGTMALIPLRQKTGIHVWAMRKNGVKSHGGVSASSTYTPRARYVILDDFISTGATLMSLRTRMESLAPFWECVGVLLYGQGCNNMDVFTDVPIFGLADEISELHKMRHKPKRPRRLL